MKFPVVNYGDKVRGTYFNVPFEGTIDAWRAAVGNRVKYYINLSDPIMVNGRLCKDLCLTWNSGSFYIGCSLEIVE